MVQEFSALPPKPSFWSSFGAGMGQGIAQGAQTGLNFKLNEMLQTRQEAKSLAQNMQMGQQFEKMSGMPGSAGMFAALGPEASAKFMQSNVSPLQLSQQLSGGAQGQNQGQMAGMNQFNPPPAPQNSATQRYYEQQEQFAGNGPEFTGMQQMRGPQNQMQAAEAKQRAQGIVPSVEAQQEQVKAPGGAFPSAQQEPASDEDRFKTVDMFGQKMRTVKSPDLIRTPQEAKQYFKIHSPMNRSEQDYKDWVESKKLESQEKSQNLAERKFALTEGKEDRKFLNETMKAADAATQVEESLKSMEQIRKKGNIGLGSAVKGIISPETRRDKAEYDTQASNIVNLYKTMFPRGVTQVEFKRITQEWLPQSNFTSATNEAREKAFRDMVDQIKKKNDVILSLQNPDGSFPKNIQALVDREMHGEESELKKKLLEGPVYSLGDTFDELPSASKFKAGSQLKDDKNNVFISDGKTWKKVSK
jgi:hypothetical protein